MPRHATNGHFTYGQAHEVYATARLNSTAPWVAPRELTRTRIRVPAGTHSVKAVRLPGTATVLYAIDPDGAPLFGVPRDHEPYAYVIRYHETDIVTLYRDGRVRLDNGGHPTVTTVRKMHEYTPEDISVSGRDIVARRVDADPRIEIAARSRRPLARLDYVDTTVTLPALEA